MKVERDQIRQWQCDRAVMDINIFVNETEALFRFVSVKLSTGVSTLADIIQYHSLSRPWSRSPSQEHNSCKVTEETYKAAEPLSAKKQLEQIAPPALGIENDDEFENDSDEPPS